MFYLMHKLACALALSTALAAQSAAHEVRPAIADVTVAPATVDMVIRLPLEPLLAGMNLAVLENTNDAPEANAHDALRALDPAALESAFRAAWPGIADQIDILSGGIRAEPRLVTVIVPEVGDVELPRDSEVRLAVDLPQGNAPVQVGWVETFGSIVVRQMGGGADAYTAILQGGTLSEPLPRDSVASEEAGTVFLRYVFSGFEHIIPKGLDHILFVLGLFFYALRARPLLAQVTAFTLAHTLTLGLASLGIVTIPASIVEPLISASIVYVAVENIFGGRSGWARVAVVFAFGLLHGLGFASVLGDVGLSGDRFLVGLIGFNIGVELGQLAVIAVAFVLLGWPFGRKAWYRSIIAVPASLAIASVGAWWTFERLFL